MSTTSITATVAAIPSAIIITIAGLFIWHWLNTDAGPFDSVKMTFQDVKIAFSCHDMETSWHYAARSYDDFRYDQPIIKLPSGNHFICRIYEPDRFRSREYRMEKLENAYNNLPKITKKRVEDWIKETTDRPPRSFNRYINEAFDAVETADDL